MKRILILISLLVLANGCKRNANETQTEIPQWSAVELLRKQHNELSDWNKLILAISLTESHFNPDAKGKDGDSGHLQLVPIYVAEVNRLYNTDYTIEDAFDIGKSVEMFNLLQDHYNPSHDINAAIRYHNRSSAYKAKVVENYNLICRMEKVREELVK